MAAPSRKSPGVGTTETPPNKPGQYRDPHRHPGAPEPGSDEHEGGTEHNIGDRRGPGVGYDQEPRQERDEGGVAES
jgi:hypothetical protein